ncbi:MAG: hypothetical protein E6Q98_15980 [Rhodospirillaceae bacterium]|nr:MAG: hypothetical protein E6Q98_15980 [Rhodospirillaceae bacterium]
MYAGPDYSQQNPGEAEYFGMDFVNQLQAGEEIIDGSQVVTISVESGSDPYPDSRRMGLPILTGSLVSQKIGGLLPDVYYIILFKVSTSLGQTLILYSKLRCVEPS